MTEMQLKERLDTADIARVLALLPHRFPMLLIDRVADLRPGKGAVGLKNVTINEPFFQGHFPGRPVMPGVLLIEAMAQTAAVVVISGLDKQDQGKLVYFMSIESARFRKPVIPGDQVYLHVEMIQNRRNVWKFRGEAKVDGTVVAEATYTAMIANDEEG
jgi:3-hydroxyacyl-[acyl-carrier-protein] dehydratase